MRRGSRQVTADRAAASRLPRAEATLSNRQTQTLRIKRLILFRNGRDLICAYSLIPVCPQLAPSLYCPRPAATRQP